MMGYPSITNTASSKTASKTIKNSSAVSASEVAAIFDDMDDDGVFNHFSDTNQQCCSVCVSMIVYSII